MRLSRFLITGSKARLLVMGLVISAIFAGFALWHYQAQQRVLQQESTALHRLLSQRVDQHDAHLTALSAVASSNEDPEHVLFFELWATITRFYPRLDQVALIPLKAGQPAISAPMLDAAVENLLRALALASNGAVALAAHPGEPGHYMMVKRSPNNDQAVYALMLAVNAGKLLDDIGSFWSDPGIGLTMTLPDGQVIFGSKAPEHAIVFTTTLSSTSQPLLVHTSQQVRMSDLFPLWPTLLLLVSMVIVVVALEVFMRQRARIRSAVEQARLSSVESRLAHASRVNALGEMAAGLAHELTQPLTAILAQAQAGRRLIKQGNATALTSVLDDTVSQAQRASTILARFRNWSRPQTVPDEVFDLRNALANVRALLAPEARNHGVDLQFSVPEVPVLLRANQVEMEQVLFNLVRNAIEAIDGFAAVGQVKVLLSLQTPHAVLDVIDNGPGVSPAVQSRLFAPFTTTRADGTGLGLTLSQRLVERAGGDISLLETDQGAAFRVVLPLDGHSAALLRVPQSTEEE